MSTLTDTIRAYAAGSLSRKEFVDELAAYPYADPSRYSRIITDPLDEWASEADRYDEPDTWDVVRRANARKLIDDPTYLSIVREMTARKERKYNEDQPRDDRGRWGSGSGDSGGGTMAPSPIPFIQMIATVEGTPRPGWAYAGPASYTLGKGQAFESAPLPKGIARGPAKQCYMNATRLVLNRPGLDYAEGFAQPPGIPIAVEHAWAVDETGHVIDNTLPDPAHTSYFGVRYAARDYLNYVTRTETYGIFGGGDLLAAEVVRTGALPSGEKALAHSESGRSPDRRARLRDLLAAERILERKYSPEQPRDDHGRFLTGDGGSEPPSTLVAVTRARGGFTYSPATHDAPKDGVAFSPYPERERTLPAASITGAAIQQYQQDNADLLAKPDHYLGAWHNHDDNNVYLDISVVTQDKSDANVQGLMDQYHQLAAYDLGKGEEIASVNPTHAPAAAAALRRQRARKAKRDAASWTSWIADASRGRTPSRDDQELRAFRDTLGQLRQELEVKYNPDQPRVPAGSSEGGEFGSGGGEATGGNAPNKSSAELMAEQADWESKFGKMGRGSPQRDAIDEIESKLASNPAYQKLTDTWQKTEGVTGAEGLMSSWINTSGDSDKIAVAMQLAAQKEFGIQDAWTGYKAATINDAKSELAAGSNQEAYQSFLRASYDATQKYFADRGVETVTLCRGVSSSTPIDGLTYRESSDAVDARLAPLSSWSSDPARASRFAYQYDGGYKAVIASEVPVSRIMGIGTAGLGNNGESEFVVLGGRISGRVHGWTGKIPYPGVGGITKWFSGESKSEKAKTVLAELDADTDQADWIKHLKDLPLLVEEPEKKYDPNQPRVPAGSPEGGEFGSGEGSGSGTPYHHTDYATASAAAKALHAAFPRTAFDFSHIPTSVANSISRAFEGVQSRCPGFIEGGMSWVGASSDMEGQNKGAVSGDKVAVSFSDGKIAFNDQIVNDRSAESRWQLISYRSWWPRGAGTWEGITTHELGHQFRNWAYGQHDLYVTGDIRRFDRENPPESAVSDYGKRNVDENWAEAFSAEVTSTSEARSFHAANNMRNTIDAINKDIVRRDRGK